MMPVFHLQTSVPLVPGGMSPTKASCQRRSFHRFRWLLRAYFEAAVEIVAHERHLYVTGHQSPDRRSGDREEPLIRFGETTESDWARSMLALGSLFRIVVITSIMCAQLVHTKDMSGQIGVDAVVDRQAATHLPGATEMQLMSGFELMIGNMAIWKRWDMFALQFMGRNA